MARKSASERANIDARIQMGALRNRRAKVDHLVALLEAGHTLERGTLNAFGQSEWGRGFDEGVADATGEA